VDSVKPAPGHVTLNLCYCIQYDLGITLCVRVHPGHETLTQYFSCSDRPGVDPRKSAIRHFMSNLCFFFHPT
jgi:hypothetical protein